MVKNKEKVTLAQKVDIEGILSLSQTLSRQDKAIEKIDSYFDKKREEVKKQKEEIVKQLDDYSKLLWNERERQVNEENEQKAKTLKSIYENITRIASVINISNDDFASLLSEKTGKKWIVVAGKSRDKSYYDKECQAWLYGFSEEDKNFNSVKTGMILNECSWSAFKESNSCINFSSCVSTPGEWVNETFINLLETNWVKPYLAHKYTNGNSYFSSEVNFEYIKPKHMKKLVFEVIDEYVTKVLQQQVEESDENE